MSEHEPETCIVELSYGTFEMPEGDWITKSCLQRGGYEMAMLRSWIPLLATGMWVIDCGACFGTHAVFAAKHGMRVIAFEPVHHRWLARNVARNAVEHLVEVRTVALSDHPRLYAAVQVKPANAGSTKMVPGDSIEAVRLDDTVAVTPSLIKIDVEGMELDVLAGAKRILAQHQPHLFVETLRVDMVDALLADFSYTRGTRFNATPTYHYHPARLVP